MVVGDFNVVEFGVGNRFSMRSPWVWRPSTRRNFGWKQDGYVHGVEGTMHGSSQLGMELSFGVV